MQYNQDKIQKLAPYDRRDPDTKLGYILTEIIYKINEIIDEINKIGGNLK